MKCRHCERKRMEHGSVSLGCPIYGDRRRIGFSLVQSYEPVAAEIAEPTETVEAA